MRYTYIDKSDRSNEMNNSISYKKYGWHKMRRKRKAHDYIRECGQID